MRLARPNIEVVAQVDVVIAHAFKEGEAWAQRLDALRQQSTVQDVLRRVEGIGEKRLLEILDQICLPADAERVAEHDRDGRWRKSKAEIALEGKRKEVSHGQALVCTGALESRDRARGAALFWGVLRIHPDEVAEDPTGSAIDMAWQHFVSWKTSAELASRAMGHRDARVFSSVAKAFRFLTVRALLDRPIQGKREVDIGRLGGTPIGPLEFV